MMIQTFNMHVKGINSAPVSMMIQTFDMYVKGIHSAHVSMMIQTYYMYVKGINSAPVSMIFLLYFGGVVNFALYFIFKSCRLLTVNPLKLKNNL